MGWRSIDGFPKYSVNQDGHIQHNRSGRIIQPQMNQSGVPYVELMRDDGRFSRGLARLVAKTFISRDLEPFDTPINLDGDRWNCAVDNLMWRPRWFAIRYHQQFRDTPRNRINRPLRASDSSEVHLTSLDAAIRYGLLEFDIGRSVLFGHIVWPTYQTFELAR